MEEYANEEDSLLPKSRDVETSIDDDTSDGGAMAWLQIAGSFFASCCPPGEFQSTDAYTPANYQIKGCDQQLWRPPDVLTVTFLERTVPIQYCLDWLTTKQLAAPSLSLHRAAL